ncbi:hypothetical protein K7X08_005082 [Anisodus acutangulus]|uniref:Uncharacterized protein n=1 Tax=Anisodus acutangulus TaxID=402998 RepID=A0A9Q1RJA6_9SOLA|nr:hypothetical protein K7X08_005082 [Anisodus acutangulus]
MNNSASMKSPFAHFEEEAIVEARRPATTKERRSAKTSDGDNEVDAKADDFINKFKQQLKLQRVDSILSTLFNIAYDLSAASCVFFSIKE